VEENDLVIATHGRSMYTLDDIAPIRAMSPAMTTAPVQLLKPTGATSSVDEAVIQYTLGRQADSLTIEILDASGTVVRSFTGGGSERPDTARGRSEVPTDSAQRVAQSGAARDTI